MPGHWDTMVTVGRIVRPHGNRGHVVVASETDYPEERFAVGATLWLKRETGVETATVTASRAHQGRWVVGLAGVESIDAAERLRGLDLRIPEETLRVLGAGAYYLHDLVGCEVVTAGRGRIGAVSRVDLPAGVPMLVVTGDGGEADEVLVPFTDAICRRVDVAARRIEIDPPDGLIDLNRRR